MLWVLKSTVSMRRFFWAPKTYVKTDRLENIYKFELKNVVYQKLWVMLIIMVAVVLKCFVWFDSLRPLNNLSVMRDGSSWVEPVLS